MSFNIVWIKEYEKFLRIYSDDYIFISFSISLDEEDEQDSDLFSKLATFLDKDLDLAEKEQVFTKTIPQMVKRAKALKSTKPSQGLYFSLQQQGILLLTIL